MKKRENQEKTTGRKRLIIPLIIVFFILGSFVFFIARRISTEMSQSAIGNLSESLELLKGPVPEADSGGACHHRGPGGIHPLL